jgi:thioredoxin 1
MAVDNINDAQLGEALSGEAGTIVKFYADWCGSCKLFAPKFKRVATASEPTGIRFIEINAEHNPEARKLAGVTNLPYLASFKKGVLVEGASTNKEEILMGMLQNLQA